MLNQHQIQCKFVPNSTKLNANFTPRRKIDANMVPKGASTKMHKCLVWTHHHTIYINVDVYAENIMQSRGISFLKQFKLIMKSKRYS